jgi:hypothetical protein
MRERGYLSRRLRTRAFAAVAVAGVVAVAPAHATELNIEAETLTPVGVGDGVQADSQASGGRALRITPAGSGEGTITVPASTTHLFLRARGRECFGAPAISVRIDGIERLMAPVSTGAYGELSTRVSLGPGLHTLSVTGADGGFASPFCERAAWIDRLTVVGQPFSPTGWRNARLSKRAPVARNSKTLVTELRRQIKSRPRGALVGTNVTSTIYTVPPDQPRVRVIARGGRPELQAQWNAVPIPSDARPSGGADARLVVWQPSSDTLWEFSELSRDTFGNWSARTGGRLPNVSRNPGHFMDPPGTKFGASATAISLLAGTQRIEELRRGAIDHAVDFAVLRTGARKAWCWPAQRTDRHLSSRSMGTIPAGTRFRLPPKFDLAAYAREHPLSRYALTVARAVQRYGMVARDTSSEIGFYAEDAGPLGFDPYPEIFEGHSPDSRGVLKNFPWRRLQVVAPPRGTGCVGVPDGR